MNIAQHNCGISPVLGVIIMVLLTVILAGITVSAVYSDDMLASLKPTPVANIDVVSAEGGFPKYPNYVKYEDNFVHMRHVAGEPLPLDSIKIEINGCGSAYEGVVPHGTLHTGDIHISYENLNFDGKDSDYSSNNQVLSDGMWSAGEELVLNGQDGISSSSTVSVTINGITNTSNNYGLKEEEIVSIKILDRKTKRIIAESECQVTLAE
nr:type IV pilin N-terminal domain-containing protein [Methanolobus bombayensis]